MIDGIINIPILRNGATIRELFLPRVRGKTLMRVSQVRYLGISRSSVYAGVKAGKLQLLSVDGLPKTGSGPAYVDLHALMQQRPSAAAPVARRKLKLTIKKNGQAESTAQPLALP